MVQGRTHRACKPTLEFAHNLCQTVERPRTSDRASYWTLVIPPEKGAKYPSQATHIYTSPMRPKNTSNTLKRHRQTFYLARRDPERWEKERNAIISANLHEAKERTRNTERDLEECKKLLKDSQQQVSCRVAICDGGLSTHKFEGQTFRTPA